MKRTYLLLILAIVVSMSACAQIPKGFKGAIDIDDLPEDAEPRGILIKNGDSFYSYIFDLSTMGVKDSWSKMYDVLESNDWIKAPDKDNCVYPSWYDQEGDLNFEDIALFCGARAGEMNKCWYINDDWGLVWQVDEDFAQVVAIKWKD